MAAQRSSWLLPAVAIGTLAAIAVAAFVVWSRDSDTWIGENVLEIGGPFELTTHTGEVFTRDDLLGSPHVVYFGFTFCPDLCPTTLFQLAQVVEDLGPVADPLEVAFITVDPERDTQAVLAEYISAFNDDFVGLTGSAEAIDTAAKAYKIYYRKVDFTEGGYTMDHTASARLFHADGSYAGAIAFDETDEDARQKIADLLAESR